MKKILPYCLFLLLFTWVSVCKSQSCQNLNFNEVANIPSTCFQMTMTALHDQLDRPYLYIANKEGGLLVYDLTNVQMPVQVGHIPVSSLGGLQVMNLRQQGTYLYLAIGNHFGTAQQSPGMAVVDVAQPGAPVLADYWSVQEPDGGAGIVAVEGDIAYLGAMKHGLIILDVTDKNDIQFLSQFVPELTFPDPNPDDTKINARGMVVRNDTVYLCYDAGGLRILDATDPAHPSEIGHYSNPALNGLPRAYNNIVLDGDLAYASVDYCGLEVLDISNPSSITLVGWWNPWDCQTNPLNWFVSPGHTNELAFLPGCDLLFTASGKSDLHVVDVSNPAQPDSCNMFGGVDNGIGTWGVSAWNNQVFLSYICNPLPFPFPSNWTGVKILDFESDCTAASPEVVPETLFSIRPNPAGTHLTIDLPAAFEHEIRLFDARGRLLLQQDCATGTASALLDLSPFEDGLFFLHLQGGWGSRTQRIVKMEDR